jgi:FtsP/CotA-like multicopper oxidase with cupredoxin domain
VNSISERSSSAFAQATALAVLAFVCAPVLAADFYLRAGATTMTMPDGATVPMWGFAPADERGVATGPITVPGPALEVPPNDNALTITVFNDLPEPVSIVIPGQVTTMTPVSFTDGQGRQRVRSFTAETAPAGSHTYTWAQLQTGTYLYHSGTHPAVQVQMGLYGALRHDAVNGVYANVPYSSDLLLLYSEVDPQLHAAVDNGMYGTAT